MSVLVPLRRGAMAARVCALAQRVGHGALPSPRWACAHMQRHRTHTFGKWETISFETIIYSIRNAYFDGQIS